VFEVVHALLEWYDGPRRGIANYLGEPHLFESEWHDGEDTFADTFLLTPIDVETLALAIEDWAIWLRWETAFHQGRVTRETHPALPEDRPRHDELERRLETRLGIDPAKAFQKAAEFRPRDDPSWSGLGWRPLEVRWYDPSRL
jgi:hypothetical protein